MTTVLVIEDEQIIRETILHLLSERGFDAIGAENGYTGVQLAQEFVPDLIVCDVKMPGIDGYETLRLLRTDPITTRIPFIFLTAQSRQAALDQEASLVADAYITKPFTLDQLLDAIARLLP